MGDLSNQKKLDIVNLYVGGASTSDISTKTGVVEEDVDAIIEELLTVASEVYEIQNETGKTITELLTEIREMTELRDKLIEETRDMHCM